MLEQLKEQVFLANKMLVDNGLITLTWGNASQIDRERGFVVIKPSGVDYATMRPEDMVVVDMEGSTVEGDLRPSSDLPTHLVLYQCFTEIGGVVHTHSTWATAFSQAQRPIECFGTTHADTFYGQIPCTRSLTDIEIVEAYEQNTGKVIVETFKSLDYLAIPGVLVGQHGPFTWGITVKKAVENAIVLEEISHLAYLTESLTPNSKPVNQVILDKHYFRKHGPNAYYGQK